MKPYLAILALSCFLEAVAAQPDQPDSRPSTNQEPIPDYERTISLLQPFEKPLLFTKSLADTGVSMVGEESGPAWLISKLYSSLTKTILDPESKPKIEAVTIRHQNEFNEYQNEQGQFFSRVTSLNEQQNATIAAWTEMSSAQSNSYTNYSYQYTNTYTPGYTYRTSWTFSDGSSYTYRTNWTFSDPSAYKQSR